MNIPETLKPALYEAIYRALYKDTRIINERDTGEHRRLTAVLVLSRVLEVLEGENHEKAKIIINNAHEATVREDAR